MHLQEITNKEAISAYVTKNTQRNSTSGLTLLERGERGGS